MAAKSRTYRLSSRSKTSIYHLWIARHGSFCCICSRIFPSLGISNCYPWWPENKSLYWLVVLSILKNMSSSMGRIIPYITENKKKMFETTNQLYLWWNVPCFSHDFPMIFPWFSHFPMIFPWFSHGFPMIFPANSTSTWRQVRGFPRGRHPPGAWSSLPRAAANCSSMLRCIASQSWRRRAPDPWDVEQTMGFI